MKNLGKFYNLTNGGKAASAGSTSNTVNSPNEYQTAVVYDLVSEGPIEGLVDGTNSIFLDKTGATISNTKNQVVSLTNVQYTASTRTLVDSDAQNLFSTFSVEDGVRYISIEGAKKTLTGNGSSTGVSGTSGTTRITTHSGSGFFTTTDANSNHPSAGSTQTRDNTLAHQYIRIEGAGYESSSSTLVAKIVSFIDAQTVDIDTPLPRTIAHKTVSIDKIGTIDSISNANTVVISNISQLGTENINVTGVSAIINSPVETTEDTHYNFERFQYAFMNGTRAQPYLSTFRGIGSSSIVDAPGQVVEATNLSSIMGSNIFSVTGGWNTSVGVASASPVIVNSSNVSNPEEVDKVKLTFQFGNMIATKPSSGDETSAIVELRIFFGFKREGDNSFTEALIFGLSDAEIAARGSGKYTAAWKHAFNSGRIRAETKAPFIETFTIDTRDFQPYSSYQIRIERLGPSSGRHGDYDHSSPCSLQTVEHILDDKLSYPYAAYGALIFDAESFAQIPKRSYDLKGLQVQVPTNYFPRGENDRALAEYDRNVTNGSNTNTYQKWDGNFRGDITTFSPGHVNFNKVWTDNPAWIFYDLISNNRYGLGKYIDQTQIDKYALFRIARYCDELVSDGKGGTEPRFSANLYLKEASEALKVLKDVASTFRGMMYWLDGEVQFSQNRYQLPIYTFTKANVVDGFKYTSTKQQYRSNQVRVTWNDPESMYKQQIEIVEDTNNILQTNRIIPKDVVAFGCTSRGQAHRFGKWNLFSEIMETEGVAFTTSINAGFLKPGDVVFVQDSDNDNIRFSGRVSSSSSTTSINIDSAVDLSSGNTFKLSIMYPSGGAYLSDEIRTINDETGNASATSSYVRGDLIRFAKVGGTVVEITTDEQASTAVDSNGEALNLVWNPNSRIETQTITTTSANATTVATSAAFSSAPTQDFIWAIREYDSAGNLSNGSPQQYVITGINQKDVTDFTITAVKYEPSKFDLIDRGYILEVGTDSQKLPSFNEIVPSPTSLTLSLAKDLNQGADDSGETQPALKRFIRINWTHPKNSDGTRYQHIRHYEIKHNAETEGIFKKVIAGKNDSSILIPYNYPKTVTVKMQAVNTTGTKSQLIQRKIEILNSSLENTRSKIGFIPRGGFINQTISIDDSTGLVSVGNSTYQFDSANEVTHLNTSTNTSTYQQAFNGMGASAEAFLLFDANASATGDRFKAVQIHTDTTAQDESGATPGFEYIKELGASNNGITQASGTVTGVKNDNLLTGSSTNFDGDFIAGDRIVIGNAGTTRFYSTIAFITSDTSIQLTDNLPRAYSGVNVFKLTFRPDTHADTILAKVLTTGSTVYSLSEIYTVSKGIVGGDGQDGQSNAIVYAYQRSPSTLTTNPGVVTVSLTGTTSGTITTGSLANGWSKTIPSGTNPLYVCAATAAGTGSTDVIAANEWSTPVILSKDGNDGLNSATVFLYQNNNTGNAPSNLPSGNVTYTFATGSIGSFGTSANGWTITNPGVTNSNKYLWVTQATAAANTATDVIADSEWATIKLLAQKGDDGAAGPRTTRTRLNFGSSSASAPTAPTSSNTNTFDFSDGNFDNILSGWSHSTPTYASGNSNKYWYIDVTIVEATFGGSQTLSFGSVTQAIGFSGLVTFSGSDITDGSTTKTPIEAGDVNANVTSINGSAITTGTISSTNLSGTADGSAFTTAGTRLTLSNGAIASKNFRIASDGTAAFKGSLTGASGTFGDATLSSTGLSISGTSSSINLGGGNFIATGAGAVTANDITLSGSITGGLSSGTGTSLVQISTGTTIFRAGADTDSPIEVVKTGTDSLVKLNNVEIYNSSGAQVFSSAAGFSDEFFSDIAQTTGTAVNTISKTVTNSSATTDAQKVVLTATQTLTISVSKPAEMSGYSFGNNASQANAVNKIPSKVQMRLMVSNNSNLSSATEIANLGTSFANGVTRTTGTGSSTTYNVDTSVESEPGFLFHEAHVFQSNNTSLLSGGKFVISNAASYSAGTYYFFAEISGSAGTQNSGINSVSNTAASRTISVSAASGENFFIDESGDGSEASSGDITSVTVGAGTGLTGGGTVTSGAFNKTLNVGAGTGITVNANDIALANTSVSAGSYTNTNLTVDAQGRITAASNGSSGSGATNLSTTTATNQITVNSSTGTNVVIGEATGSIAGLMSTTHHNKLDGIAASATSYTSNQATNNNSNVTFDGLRVGDTTAAPANTIQCTGDVVAFASSDKRLKNNLTPITNSLEKINKLTGYEFDWNDKQDVHIGHDIGIVAQEVEEVLPEIVETRTSGYKAVKYEKITALLINAVNDLTQEVEDLKEKLDGNRK